MSQGIKERVDGLLSAEMDRASFIKLCGVAVLAAAGITGVIRTLTSSAKKPRGTAQSQAGAYGGRSFGG